MKKKGTKAITLAVALALAMSTAAWAVPGPVPDPLPPHVPGETEANDEYRANSDTTISIFTVSETDVPSVSYTVPLYVTMAVANGKTDVKVPDNYGITNTSGKWTSDPTKDIGIGVTNMTFEKINPGAATTFNTVEAGTVIGTTAADKDKIILTIAGITMPAVNADKPIQSITPSGTVLWNGDKPKELTGTTLLPITGTVGAIERDEDAAAAQFKLKYTVSLISKTGASLGAVYSGDDRTAAGLEAWTASN